MENTTDIQGLKIFYRDRGEGLPIIILHGWGASSNSWIKVQEYLADKNFRVILLDLPGFGASDEPKEPWNLKDYSDFVNKFAGSLDLDYFALGGHSFGGRIAIYFATQYPKKLKALILIAAAGVMRHKKVKVNTLLALTKIGNIIFSLPILSFLRSYAEKIWYRLTGEHDYQKASPMMRQIMQNVLTEELKPYLPRIGAPTLILWGEKDEATPLSDGLTIRKIVPESSIHVFKDMPHAIHLKIPYELSEKIAEFLHPL